MMPEPTTPMPPAEPRSRPFPWFCPRCRRKEVWRTTLPYECQRIYRGKPITIVIPALAVPRCGNCGELDFDYEAEEQINRAYTAQTEALSKQADPTDAPAAQVANGNSQGQTARPGQVMDQSGR
jgi:hypothetical protein